MTAFLYIPVPITGFIQLDIEDLPMQKIKKYQQKFTPANLCFRCLVLGSASTYL